MPCKCYNQGNCLHQKSHKTGGTLYKHECTECFAVIGKTFMYQSQNVITNRQGNQKRLAMDMSLGIHTHHFETYTIYSRNIDFHSKIKELEVSKQWYYSERFCWCTTPLQSYAEVTKKQKPQFQTHFRQNLQNSTCEEKMFPC